MDTSQLRNHIIIPTLEHLGKLDKRLNSLAAENLLMGTAAKESLCGQYIKQIGGHGLGIFQMKPDMHDDIITNYLHYKDDWYGHVMWLRSLSLPDEDHHQELIYNMRYACAMARLHYWLVPYVLPDANDIIGMAIHWKKYYNTAKGAGTSNGFVKMYNQLILGL